MLELDTTIMTPSPVFEASGHVARFADWMVKDLKTGDVLRADHLVKTVLQERLAGDKEARGLINAITTTDKKKKEKNMKKRPVKLEDHAVEEYSSILAQVSPASLLVFTIVTSINSLTITMDENSVKSAAHMI